jgi:hypothetical protein
MDNRDREKGQKFQALSTEKLLKNEWNENEVREFAFEQIKKM